MRIVAIIPISGRLDILKITIPKLLNQVERVILVGNIAEDKDLSSEIYQTYFPSADFYYSKNYIKRGDKWQFALEKAQDYNPDAVLVSSSGGVFRDDYFNVEITDVLGSGDLFYLDYTENGKRMFYWPGYVGARSEEPVGLGRLISKDFLNRCSWNVFPRDVQSGLDFRSMQTFRKYDADIRIIKGNPPLRISSYKYTQTNAYDRMVKMNHSNQKIDIDNILKQYGL